MEIEDLYLITEMKVVNSKQMREIDRKAIEEYKIPSLNLMEKAGESVYKFIKSSFGSPDNKNFYIFCGKGNNGGDGFVVGRFLYKNNGKVKIFLLGKIEELKGDAKVNLDLIQKMQIDICEILTTNDIKKLAKFFNKEKVDLILDAILGTGTKGEITGLTKEVIEIINQTKIPIISVDLPSGLNADTGEILGCCIKANYTVTMGLPKIGLLIYPGADYVGELKIADIGFPEELIEKENIKINLITKEMIKDILIPRKANTHKGNYGKVFILAGSVGFTGAAYLCSQSAIRTGAGLVTLGIPESLNEIMEIKLTEVMTKLLPETKEKTLSLKAEKEIKKQIKRADVLAIGPGLSLNIETKKLVKKIIKEINLPTVIDADGLNALAEDSKIISKCKANLILTPHPGEMSRLIKEEIFLIQKDRINFVKKFAQEFNCVLVLKGARSIICDSLGNVFINPTGNPGMASGGTGDVLTGMIVGLLACGISPLNSSIAGVYLHGLAGDLSLRKYGEISLIASDILEFIPQAIFGVQNC